MARKQRYYPGNEAAQVIWLTNYRGKISLHGPTCVLTAGEIADTIADIDFLIWVLGTWNRAIQKDAEEATDYKDSIEDGDGPSVPVPAASTFSSPPAVRPPGVLNRLFNQVARIKKAAGYTTPIGTDLGIIGAEDTAEHPVPLFKLKKVQGLTNEAVQVDFIKYDHPGVWIECRRNNGPWEPLGADLFAPYLDDRPLLVAGQAEVREYRLRWFDGNKPTGDWSPVMKITVGP